jgi:hypothetical protein
VTVTLRLTVTAGVTVTVPPVCWHTGPAGRPGGVTGRSVNTATVTVTVTAAAPARAAGGYRDSHGDVTDSEH